MPRPSPLRVSAHSAPTALLAPLLLALACQPASNASDPPTSPTAPVTTPEPAPAPADAPAAIDDRDYAPTAADEKAAAAEAAAGNRFGDALYAELAKTAGNRFLSPLSVRIALAMTYAGAQGTTATEMAAVLRFTREGDALHGSMAALQADLATAATDGQTLAIANRLWGARGEGFLAPFLQRTRSYYGAALAELDFSESEAARQTINAWVAEHTAGKIPELLAKGAVDGSTALVLTNAIYFKGLWARPFDPKKTVTSPFKAAGGKSVATPMMTQKARFLYAEVAGAQVVELPYVGERLAMTLVLPSAVDGLAALESALASKDGEATIEGWLASGREREVDVTIPRFNVESSFSLGDTLKAMGMNAAFGAADFSAMNGRKDLRISAVIHRAVVQVAEEGTEAAAATGVIMTRSGAAGPTPRFVADHPFLFAIRDRQSGAIIFLGRLVDPGA